MLLRMVGSLEEYVPDGICRISAELATILELAPSDFDVLARARSARRNAAGVDLVITFKSSISEQSAAILAERVKNGTVRSLAGFEIDAAELLPIQAAPPSPLPTLLPTGSPSLNLTGVPSLLLPKAPSSVPSLVPSETPSVLPTLVLSSHSENTSLRPLLSPTWKPMLPSSLPPSQRPSSSPSRKPTRMPTTREPLIADVTTIPPTAEDQRSSTEPTLELIPPPSAIGGTEEVSFSPSADPETADSRAPITAAPSLHPLPEPTAPAAQATELPVILLTRPPTRLPTAAPTALPRTPAPVSPGDPPATADPTLAPTPIPCPGQPPCTDHGNCDKAMGTCACHAGWYRGDCSEYLLTSLARGNTSELQAQAEIRLLLAEMPKADVVCRVSVAPANAAWANASRLTLAPQAGLDQIEASLIITGQPDWKPDGDTLCTVRIGPCTSADARFNGIGTSIRLMNRDVPLPLVTAVVPSAVHTSGRSVTVRGNNFGPDALIFFCGSVLGHSSVPGKWVWVHNNATGLDLPIRRAQLALLRHAVVGGGNAESITIDSSHSITIDEPGMNSTLCDAMGQEGFELSNCTGGVLDFEPDADPELSVLLRVRCVNDSVFTFVTPCLSKVVLLPRMHVALLSNKSCVCTFCRPLRDGSRKW